MSHTPGPWRWKKLFENGRVSTNYYINSNTLMIGNVFPCASMSLAESHANAKLIAAAPDLLAACKFVADKLNDPGLVAILDDAIRKAEGN